MHDIFNIYISGRLQSCAELHTGDQYMKKQSKFCLINKNKNFTCVLLLWNKNSKTSIELELFLLISHNSATLGHVKNFGMLGRSLK